MYGSCLAGPWNGRTARPKRCRTCGWPRPCTRARSTPRRSGGWLPSHDRRRTSLRGGGGVIDLAGAAEEVADTLFASAEAVERTGTVSRSSLDLLAQQGFYGIAGPRELGGLPDRDVWHLVETIASGCLATAFVWIQHHSALRAVAASGNAGLQERWCAPMSRGQVRAGLALGGLRPGPATVRARREPGGYRLDGEAPWVTGWGLIDVVHVAARDEDDTIVWALLDAGAPLRAEVQDLVAVTASRTATVY